MGPSSNSQNKLYYMCTCVFVSIYVTDRGWNSRLQGCGLNPWPRSANDSRDCRRGIEKVREGLVLAQNVFRLTQDRTDKEKCYWVFLWTALQPYSLTYLWESSPDQFKNSQPGVYREIENSMQNLNTRLGHEELIKLSRFGTSDHPARLSGPINHLFAPQSVVFIHSKISLAFPSLYCHYHFFRHLLFWVNDIIWHSQLNFISEKFPYVKRTTRNRVKQNSNWKFRTFQKSSTETENKESLTLLK